MKYIITILLTLVLSFVTHANTGGGNEDTLQKVKTYYSSDTTKVMDIGYYLNGEKHGKWVRYSETTGEVLSTIYFDNGKKDGKWVIKDEQGVKRYVMWYDQGKRIKTWKIWNADGSLKDKRKF